jgi:chorismate mutase
MWEIPIELKRQFPEMPVVCDPSHICGNKTLLEEIAQKALDLEMNGLMIESHIDPEHALTDAAQQITPSELREMLSRLVIRQPLSQGEIDIELEKLRSEIDKLDSEFIRILSQRMEIVKEIADQKQHKNLTILQLRRWSDLIYDRISQGEKLGLNRSFLFKLLNLIHQESIDIQEEGFKKSK